MLKLGVKMKWRSPHTQETESAYLICSVLISVVVLQGRGEKGGNEGKKRKRGHGAARTLLQSHDDEAIKVNSSWQTHPINKLTLHKRKHGLSADNEGF